MKILNFARLVMPIGLIAFLSACEKPEVLEDLNVRDEISSEAAENNSLKSAHRENGFVHGIVVEIDGVEYYFEGPPDGPEGQRDIPGHTWVNTGTNKLKGKHYNTGPFGESHWWSSDAEDGELLYMVDAIIDEWTEEKAESYSSKGYVHYHEFIEVSDPTAFHPTKVAWLKHIARTSFTLDGGPGAPNPPYEHQVSPGIDYGFIPNYHEEYDPEGGNH